MRKPAPWRIVDAKDLRAGDVFRGYFHAIWRCAIHVEIVGGIVATEVVVHTLGEKYPRRYPQFATVLVLEDGHAIPTYPAGEGM